MDNYSRDLPRGTSGGDKPGHGEQKMDSHSQTEELELNLGSRFVPERRIGGGVARSSSVACIQEVALARPPLARTNSLPMMADAEGGDKQNKTEVEPAVKLRASLSPGTGSSDGEGILTRASSPPVGIEDGSRKRNVAQTLERSELKRRIERLNSSNGTVEEVGEKSHEMNATANNEKALENCDDLPMKNEQPEGKLKVGRMNHSNVRRRSSGRPPRYRPPVASQGSCLPGNPKRQNSALEGTPSAEGRILSSAFVPSSEDTNGVHQAEGANSTVMATASSSPSAVRAAALGSGEEQQDASERPVARATRSVGDVERPRAREMPLVCTRDLPNGRRMKGILYKYKKVDEVTIVCVCHGRFLTPAEFVEHAGGGQVANPLRHIDINFTSPF